MSKIAIYGAGGNGRVMLEALRAEGLEPSFFIDQFTRHREVMGKPVYRLSEAPERDITTLYVSIPSAPHPLEAEDYNLIADLKVHGFWQIISFEEALIKAQQLLRTFGATNLLWMRSQPHEMIHEEGVAHLDKLLADQKSRELLSEIIAMRRTMKPESYVQPDGQCEYFPDDIDLGLPSSGIRFADCGAYIGDTAMALMRHFSGSVDYVASFEPDAANLKALMLTASRLAKRHKFTRFFVHPCCVWSSNEVLSFQAGRNSSSAIVEQSDTDECLQTLAAVSLDTVLHACPPNFIKMDIEGAEIQAVQGAKDIIRNNLPTLALCVYHRPSDLWEIPLAIHRLVPRYRLYLRCHGHLNTGLILYCVRD